MDCALLLIENRLGFHGYPHVRQILEASAHIRCLVLDPEHLKNMELQDVIEQRQLAESAYRGNRFISSVADSEKELGADLKKKELKLKDSGAVNLTMKELFDRANARDVYECYYKYCSSHAHSSFNALDARHFDRSKTPIRLKGMDHGSETEFFELTTLLVSCVVDVSQIVHEYFGTEQVDLFTDFIARE